MNKIDFVGFIMVDHANPNGDPLTGNMPRCDYDNIGEMTQNCLRRKIRNRLMDLGEPIFVQSDDNKVDNFDSLHARLEGTIDKETLSNVDTYIAATKERWLDVRAFGQVFAFKSKGKNDKGVSCHVRGCVSISSAFSISPINIESVQITKSVNSESGDTKGSDTMGMSHRVKFGLYRFSGSILPKLADLNNFDEVDSEKVIEAIRTMFVNDESTARPSGSMEMNKLFIVKHDSEIGTISTAAVNRGIKVTLNEDVNIPTSIDDYSVDITELENKSGIEIFDACEV